MLEVSKWLVPRMRLLIGRVRQKPNSNNTLRGSHGRRQGMNLTQAWERWRGVPFPDTHSLGEEEQSVFPKGAVHSKKWRDDPLPRNKQVVKKGANVKMAGRQAKWRKSRRGEKNTDAKFGGAHQQLRFDGISGRGEVKAVITPPRTFTDMTRRSSVDEMQTPLGLKKCVKNNQDFAVKIPAHRKLWFIL